MKENTLTFKSEVYVAPDIKKDIKLVPRRQLLQGSLRGVPINGWEYDEGEDL